MPTYTYTCPKCGNFEQYASIANYTDNLPCPNCKRKSQRNLLVDSTTVIGIGDGAPKTLGALAEANANKLSEDEKIALHKKHNAYKETPQEKKLPKGMYRLHKPESKPWWNK